MKNSTIILFLFAAIVIWLCTCDEEEEPQYPTLTRLESLPADAVKITPENDLYPPILHSDEYETPVSLEGPVNTAGAEDSPFFPADVSNCTIRHLFAWVHRDVLSTEAWG